MQTLLSLPPNLVDNFHSITGLSKENYYCSSDPKGNKLGSGGGTTWLLEQCWKAKESDIDFSEWLSKEKRILIHACGQSRRLPGYATSGKILTPIPVFRWACGQKLNQCLLDLQIPLYEKILNKAPNNMHTLVCSGDVYIRTEGDLQTIPEADIVCYGLWVDSSIAMQHGIFASRRETPDILDRMLQKPSIKEIEDLSQTHFYLMDLGVWLLSDRAVEVLRKKSYTVSNGQYTISNYDLYSEFGFALGNNPSIIDKDINSLSVAILPLPCGEFYHYGTNKELISSTLSIQNLVYDQKRILLKKIKPHPAIFVQNSITDIVFTSENSEIWIENSCISKGWRLSRKNIITGVPDNNWSLTLTAGTCIDVTTVGKNDYVARVYDFDNPAKNAYNDKLFPLCHSIEELGTVLHTLLNNIDSFHSCEIDNSLSLENNISSNKNSILNNQIIDNMEMWSAEQIADNANLIRLFRQRDKFRIATLPTLAKNYNRSIFYYLNLDDTANIYSENNIILPPALPDNADIMLRIRDNMFRSKVHQLRGESSDIEEHNAFTLLQKCIIESTANRIVSPHLNIFPDQIVWGRSPVRIDLAGGWTDTPPYCINFGGDVINISINLNGQQPIQVYVKPSTDYSITLRSIDLGAREVVSTYEELTDYKKVGSPFSISKAALSLAGFSPDFSGEKFKDLETQLKSFGCGIEITLLAAIPAGSGLGTSSVLAATVLSSLSDFCGLNWDEIDCCNRALILEQLLTTGGGWQDQYGGVINGVKWLHTQQGFDQTPIIRWLPDSIFTNPEYKNCHLLYYTGISRTAKKILAEIVRGMFLNETKHIELLHSMKHHAANLYETIQQNNFDKYGSLIATTWNQNKELDSGTNPPEIEAMITKIKDYCLGYKLPGAGGGGYLYMVAKDMTAAAKIKQIMTSDPPNQRARFVEMSLSGSGLEVSRS